MNKAIILSAALVATTAHAGEVHETCSSLSEQAETVATMRYSGNYTMRELMGALDTDLGRALVRDAYNLPDYATDDMQQRTARQDGDDVYAQCYDHYSED